jgi:hypothetical protein
MKSESTKRRPGRPSAFQDWMAPYAEVLYEFGATNADVARAFEVQESTVYAWIEAHPEFSEALKTKVMADERVVRSLYDRATGYVAPDGSHIPAHPTAIIFWLKNRQAAKWRDKTEVQTQIATDNTDPQMVLNQLVTIATQFPTLNPVIRKMAIELLQRIPDLGMSH